MAYVIIIIIIIITVAYPARAVTWFMSPGVFDVSLGIISELVEPCLRARPGLCHVGNIRHSE